MSNTNRWLILLACAATITTIAMGVRQSFGLFLPEISQDLGFGREVFAFAVAAQNLLWGAFAPVFGLLAHRYGSIKFIIVGALCYVAGLVISGFASTGTHLLLGQLLLGVGLGGVGFSLVLGAVVNNTPLKWRSLALGVVTSGGSFGQFLCIPIAQSLLDSYGWGFAFFWLALIAATMIAFSLGLRAINTQANSGAASAQAEPAKEAVSVILRRALSYRSYQLLTAGFFVCGLQVVFVATHLPSYLRDRAMDPEITAWAFSMIGLFNILGSLACGWLGGRYSKKNSLAWLYTLRSLVVIAFLALPLSGASAIAFGAALGLLWLGTVPLTSGLVAHMFGARDVALLYGFAFFSHQLGSFLGAWLGGFIYDASGSYDWMWAVVILSGFAAAFMHAPIKEKQHPELAPA